MQKSEKISAFMIAYNEEKLIERALKSLKGIVNEIIVIHDGHCDDNTLKIAKKYTNKIFIPRHKGRAALHLIFALKKCKNDWCLKVDADEFLSEKLKKNINRLAQNKNASAYTFKWLIWDGKKYVTKNWPRKKSMFRKSSCSFIQFPGWDEPRTIGETIQTDYLLQHRPPQGKSELFWKWSTLWKKSSKRCKSQAKYTLKDFSKIKKFQYNKNKFPIIIRIRKKFPILSSFPFALFALFKIPFSKGAWKEGLFVFKGGLETSFYYLALGFYINKFKKKKHI